MHYVILGTGHFVTLWGFFKTQNKESQREGNPKEFRTDSMAGRQHGMVTSSARVRRKALWSLFLGAYKRSLQCLIQQTQPKIKTMKQSIKKDEDGSTNYPARGCTFQLVPLISIFMCCL